MTTDYRDLMIAQIDAMVAKIHDLLLAETDRLQREKRHLARVAHWFTEHEPGAPVPDWCALAWGGGEPFVDPEHVKMSEAAWLECGVPHPMECDCEQCDLGRPEHEN